MNCPECGLNLALVGRVHACRPRVAVEGVTNSPAVPVTNISVTNNVAKPVTNSVDRVAAWRAANPDRYREYQRTYMAKRRALSAGE